MRNIPCRNARWVPVIALLHLFQQHRVAVLVQLLVTSASLRNRTHNGVNFEGCVHFRAGVDLLEPGAGSDSRVKEADT